MPDFCLVVSCGKRINVRPSVSGDDYSVVKCGKCKSLAHAICAGLKKEEVQFYLETNKTWICSQCELNESSLRYISPSKEQSSANEVLLNAIKEVNTKLDDQRTYYFDAISKLEKRLDSFIETAKKMDSLTKENASLKKSVSDLEGRLLNIEQQMRETSIDIVGVPLMKKGNDKENTREVVLKILNTGLEMNVMSENIIDCYRIYPKHKNVSSMSTNHPPLIAVKLSNSHITNTILGLKRKMKTNLNTKKIFNTSTSNPIFVNENLCPGKRFLFNEARKVMKNLNYSYVWTRRGVVLMKKNDESDVQTINGIGDLSKLK